jgi:hypothetical protein
MSIHLITIIFLLAIICGLEFFIVWLMDEAKRLRGKKP